jgi:hypothetical protein
VRGRRRASEVRDENVGWSLHNGGHLGYGAGWLAMIFFVGLDRSLQELDCLDGARIDGWEENVQAEDSREKERSSRTSGTGRLQPNNICRLE